jgi:flagellar protein FlgJ
VTIAGATDSVMNAGRVEDAQAAVEARMKLAAASADRAGAAGGFRLDDITSKLAGPDAGPRAAFEKFESFVLQTFIQSMLPQDTESVYGEGLSGDMWKSLLAEHIAADMTKAGGIGIADRILADYYRRGEEIVPLTGAGDEASREDAASRAMLNLSLVQQMQRRVAHSLEAQPPATGVTTAPRS